MTVLPFFPQAVSTRAHASSPPEGAPKSQPPAHREQNDIPRANTKGGADGGDDDPAEVDISTQTLRSKLLRSPISDPAARQDPQPDADPMLRMFQQLLGSTDGSSAADPTANLPPGIADFLTGTRGTDDPSAQDGRGQARQKQSQLASMWRLVHAVFSLSLALHVALFSSTEFDGSKARREATGNEMASIARGSFWPLFATSEIVLQGGRFFLERGRAPTTGVLGGLARLLPQPWAGYVVVFERYGVIYSTVVADALVVVFVLGAVGWMRS